jgi:hypothetical protein
MKNDTSIRGRRRWPARYGKGCCGKGCCREGIRCTGYPARCDQWRRGGCAREPGHWAGVAECRPATSFRNACLSAIFGNNLMRARPRLRQSWVCDRDPMRLSCMLPKSPGSDETNTRQLSESPTYESGRTHSVCLQNRSVMTFIRGSDGRKPPKLTNWNTFGGAISVSKTLAWQMEPRGFGSVLKIYHSSNSQQPRQQHPGGNIAIAGSRGAVRNAAAGRPAG